MALAQELMDPSGGPSGAYHLAMARLQLQKEQFKDAEESIQEALQYSYQVGPSVCLSVCRSFFFVGLSLRRCFSARLVRRGQVIPYHTFPVI